MTSPIEIDNRIRTLDVAALPVLPGTPASTAEAKAHRRHLRRVERRRFERMTQHGQAVAHLDPLPGPDESLHGVISGSYSGWSIATAIVDLLAVPVYELVISTLGFNRQNLDSLVTMLDAGTVRSVLLNVSNYFRHSDREIFADCRRTLESRGHRVAVTRSHAKLLLLRAGERHIVVETSANLRSSKNWEQFVISDDAELFDFHRQWILDLIDSTEDATNDDT
jgi:hypothetical protein